MTKKVLLSQNIRFLPERNETIDYVDKAWHGALINILGDRIILFPMPNVVSVALDFCKSVEPDLIVLTGGNDLGVYEERDAAETILLKYAVNKGVPVLGVCRGMLFMNHFSGGFCHRVDGHVATNHTIYSSKEAAEPVEIQVNSFIISICKNDLASSLRLCIESEGGLVEVMVHESYPWLGVMWHPERICRAERLVISSFQGGWRMYCDEVRHCNRTPNRFPKNSICTLEIIKDCLGKLE